MPTMMLAFSPVPDVYAGSTRLISRAGSPASEGAWTAQGSNLCPPACEAGAHTAELAVRSPARSEDTGRPGNFKTRGIGTIVP